MGENNITNQPDRLSSVNYLSPIQVPKSVQKKISQGHQVEDLGKSDLMHLHLKTTKQQSWLQRTFSILFASAEKKALWEASGKQLHSTLISSSSVSEEEARIGASTSSIFNSETASAASSEETATTSHTQSAHLLRQTLLQDESARAHLNKMFPSLNLENANPQQLAILSSLLKSIDEVQDPASHALLLKVVKHQTAGQIPSTKEALISILEGFKKLDQFRKQVGDAVFVASNWKGQLTPGQSIDDAFVAQLSNRLTQQGWANCMKRLLDQPGMQQEQLDKFVFSILADDEKKGRASFDTTGEKEKMLMALLAASDEDGGFFTQLFERLEGQTTNLLDQTAAAVLSPTAFIAKLTQEIRAENSGKRIDAYKQQFAPSLSSMIDDYLKANFPDAPPQQSELPAPDELPKMLLLYKMGENTQLLARDALTDETRRDAFHKAFAKFLPKDPSLVTSTQIEALDQMAKMGGKLIDTYAYDLSEVIKWCKNHFKTLQTRKQQLSAPADAQALNILLLKSVSPKAGWQTGLQEATKLLPEELVSGLTSALKKNNLLQPRNQDELSALAALLAAGAEIHQAQGFPIGAIVLGLTDYLSEQRQRNETFTAPILMAAAAITPFCYQHLTAMDGWKDKLMRNVPLAQQEFCRTFSAHMLQATGLVGPINDEELAALEKLVQLGAEIVHDRHNAYDADSVAAGCVAYLQRMRDERRSFAEITSLGGLITHVTTSDLYPLCFTGLIDNLLKEQRDRQPITQLLSQTIKGQTQPLTEQGRQRLQALIKEMTNKDFAQGKGVRHFAAAAKFPSILFDLRLNTVDELNTSSISPERLHVLFNYVQHEQFNLPDPSEIFAEVHQRPIASAKTLTAGVVKTLMGEDHKDLEPTVENLNKIIDDLAEKDPGGVLQIVQSQLNKLAGQLGLSESAGISVSIDTAALISGLRSEAQRLQAPYQNNQEILQLLDSIQHSLEKEKAVKEYLELSSAIEKKAGKEKEPSTKKTARLQELNQDPHVASYQKFLTIKDGATTEKSAEETQTLIGQVNQLITEMPAPTTAKPKKTTLFSFTSKQAAPIDVAQDLHLLTEKLALPRTIHTGNLNSFGIAGELAYRGVNALAELQAARNRGTYGNNDELREIAEGLKFLESKFVGLLAKTAISLAPAALVSKGIEIGIKLQTRSLNKAIRQAQKEGRSEDEQALQAQLKVLELVRNNSKSIAEAVMPIATVLLKNHKLHKHGDAIKTLRKILEDPSYVITESDKAMLAGQLAQSADTLLAEIGQHYPRLLEELIDTVMNLPNQGKASTTPQQQTVVPAPEPQPLSAEQLGKAADAAQRFADKLQTEFPLRSEDEAKTAARKAMEEEEAAKAAPAASDWFGSFTQGWNQFAKAVESAVQDASDSAKSAFVDYERNQIIRDILSPLQSQLANHPFLADHFDEGQLDELLALTKEAAAVQTNNGYSADIMATACRLFIESEVDSQGKLNIPTIPRLNEPTTAEKLAQYAFSAVIEHAVGQSGHPNAANPYFIRAVVALISHEIVPSETALNETGQKNLASLVQMMLDPTFADGKPLDLPVVTTQFKYMFPKEFNSATALNASEIPPDRLELFKETSKRQVRRGINLGSLQAGITNHTVDAIALLASPLQNFASDKKTADDMQQAVRAFADDLQNLGQLGWVKQQMEAYLEKLGVLKAVQVDVSISTRQATSKLRNEGQNLKAFMDKEKRIPTDEEAQSIGAVTPLLCTLVKQAALVKEVINGGTAQERDPTDPVRLAAEALPEASIGLKYAKPFIGLAQGSPVVSNLLAKAVVPVLKIFVFEAQVNQLQQQDSRTEEEEQQLELFTLLLKEENIEKMNALATPIVASILTRHDFAKYGALIDQIVKIGDRDNPNGVDEVELMSAIVETADVFLDEVDQHYSELIPDLLNAVKAIQFLGLS